MFARGRPVARLPWVALLVLAAVLLAACRAGKDTPAGGGAASPVADSVPALFGGPSTRGVVLFAGGRQTGDWGAFATELGRLGYRVLLLPLPEGDPAAAAAAAAEALTRQGVERIVYVGSGAGTAAALAGAAAGASGVVILNPVGSDPAVAGSAIPAVASLVMASLADGPSSATAQRLYQSAHEPRRLALYPARDPAPAAFAAAGELRDAFLEFLRRAFTPLSA